MTARRRAVPDEMFGGRLRGCFFLELQVADHRDGAGRRRTIRFRSPDLVDFAWAPGQDLMFEVPGHEGIRRRYTIRRADAPAGTIDVEVELHGGGPFASWAAAAVPGARIEAIGPRGKNPVRPGVHRHLLVGDASARPVTSVLAEALPADSSATILLVDDGETLVDDELKAAAETVALTVLRHEVPAALAEVVREPADTAVYAFGEHHLVRAVRDEVLRLGVSAELVETKAYWRHDQANAAHGEPSR